MKALGSRSRRAHSHHVQPCSLSNRLPAPSCEITSSSAVCRVSAIDSCVEIFATSACISVVCAPVSCVCSLFAASVAAVRRVNELSTTTRCCDTKLSAVLKAVVSETDVPAGVPELPKRWSFRLPPGSGEESALRFQPPGIEEPAPVPPLHSARFCAFPQARSALSARYPCPGDLQRGDQ